MSFISFGKGLGSGTVTTSAYTLQMQYGELGSRFPTASVRFIYTGKRGWSGGAKVLGKLQVPGRPTNLAYSRARAYYAFSRCGWVCSDIFSLIIQFSFLSPCLWETARYRLKYCLKGQLSPKQPNNQILEKCNDVENPVIYEYIKRGGYTVR